MSLEPDPKAAALLDLAALHREVDSAASFLSGFHAGRLRCRRGCKDCCVDGLTVFSVEAEQIRQHAKALLAAGAPHPSGACAFLDESGACRIYEHRPYTCRTQGLPFRWLEERALGEVVELRDICPLNDAGPPIETLPAETLWTVGPFEERLRAIERRFSTGELQRVALRELFDHQGVSP